MRPGYNSATLAWLPFQSTYFCSDLFKRLDWLKGLVTVGTDVTEVRPNLELDSWPVYEASSCSECVISRSCRWCWTLGIWPSMDQISMPLCDNPLKLLTLMARTTCHKNRQLGYCRPGAGLNRMKGGWLTELFWPSTHHCLTVPCVFINRMVIWKRTMKLISGLTSVRILKELDLNHNDGALTLLP